MKNTLKYKQSTTMESFIYVLTFAYIFDESFQAAINITSSSPLLQQTVQNISNDSDYNAYYYYDIPPDDGSPDLENSTSFNFAYDDVANGTSDITYNKTDENYSNLPSDDDYLYEDQYFDSYGICSSNALTASDVVQVLSPEIDVSTPILNHWTIAPWYRGGSVTVAKRDNVVTDDIFLGGCGDLEIFQSELNGTTIQKESSWCHEKRLLPCDANMQMTYHIFGYSLISEPGKAVDVVYTPMSLGYDYDTTSKKTPFSMYYYECGGHRFGGDIRSPIFPDEEIPYTGSVTCTWMLDVENSADYGILRFSRFHLPHCENHHLIIEEDTIIEEKDVTQSLLMMLDQNDVEKNQTMDESTQDYDFAEYNKALNTSEMQELTKGKSNFTSDENKNAYFYRESKISEEEARKNPRAGIHAVVITKYCGKYQPKRTLYWRRGSENVTLTFVSEHHTVRKYGFVARFSAFSWSSTMKEHRELGMGKFTPKSRAVSGEIFNYIVLIVFVPIGLTIGLAIIVFHIKKRGPTIQDFYRKEKKMLRLRRANTERVKSRSPKIQRPARRTQSLDYPHSIPEDSELAESELLVKPNQVRRGSLLNVRFLMGARRKLSFQLGNNSINENTAESKTRETVHTPMMKKSGLSGVS
uniref:uncharacterized protein LOC120328141 n=1 Tax=Styela clava TaxID=7725 RepID=UPI00193A318E|nr:uncharacterized protein LOC120328141 [Styela clava]